MGASKGWGITAASSIVSGRIYVTPGQREGFLASSRDAVIADSRHRAGGGVPSPRDLLGPGLIWRGQIAENPLELSSTHRKGDVTMPTGTVRLHRVLRASPEKVYRAFLDPDAMVKWLPPHGFTGKVHHLDAKVGGTFKMSFTNFTSGHGHSFGGEYLELVPNERIRHTDKFDDPNLPGEMQVTVSLRKVFCGTELNILQEGIPDVIPAEACYLGWQESLTLLAQLTEPEIPGELRPGQPVDPGRVLAEHPPPHRERLVGVERAEGDQLVQHHREPSAAPARG